MGKAGEEGGEMGKAQPFVPVEHTKLASGRQSMAWRQGKNQKWREKKARQWTNHWELEWSNAGEKRHRGRQGSGTQHSQDGAQTQQSSRALHSHCKGPTLPFVWAVLMEPRVLQKGRYVLTEPWLCYNEWIWKNWNTANAENARKIVFLPWRGQKQTLINFLPLIHLHFTDGADQFFCIKLHWCDSVERHQHKSDSGNKRVLSACFPASFSQTLQSAFNFSQWNGKFYRKPAKVEPEDKNLDGLNLW